MTARGTQTIKYDPEQRPIRIQDGNAISRATYDGDGVRRKRVDSNGTVHYLGGYERKLAGGSNSSDTVTKYYSASLGALSRPLAFRRGGTLHWVGADHLGGTIRVMDSSFTAVDGMRYKPYGEDRDTGSDLVTDRKFTGQTEDETAGLYWYASRAYDPAIGRFVSPDVLVPDPSNPQSLNRYAYVYNNPVGNVDPSGHGPDDWDPDWADRFTAAHPGRKITDKDWADYQHSLRHRGSGPGGAWTPQDWVNYSTPPAPAPNIQDHKANLAENFNPTIVLADQAREDHLAENYNTTIQPRDPTPVASTPAIFEITTNQAESVVKTLGTGTVEKYIDVTGKAYGIPKESMAVFKTGFKRVVPYAGVAIDAVSTYSGERSRGTSEMRALAVTVTEVGITTVFTIAGTAMFGLPGGIAFAYVGNKIAKESDAGDTVADFLGW